MVVHQVWHGNWAVSQEALDHEEPSAIEHRLCSIVHMAGSPGPDDHFGNVNAFALTRQCLLDWGLSATLSPHRLRRHGPFARQKLEPTDDAEVVAAMDISQESAQRRRHSENHRRGPDRGAKRIADPDPLRSNRPIQHGWVAELKRVEFVTHSKLSFGQLCRAVTPTQKPAP